MAKSSFTRAVNSNSLKRIGCMLLGVGVGTFISRKLSDTVQTSGVDGISQYSHYIGPANQRDENIFIEHAQHSA